MSIFYKDIWICIGKFLDSDDLFSMSATCKAAHRALNTNYLQEKISWPLIRPKRLTAEQREVINKMEKLDSSLKLIYGSVGSGKTITSLAYALRKREKYENKIIIAVPPNLIKMWKDTCINFFGISPYVFHTSNKNYKASVELQKTEVPEEKILLFSYKILSFNNFSWMANRADILIIDEAHHYLYLSGKLFTEVIALSATAFKNEDLSYGIKSLYKGNINNVMFDLNKKIIGSKLPEVISVAPYIFKLKPHIVNYILDKKMQMINGKNNLKDMKWIPELLTHPFISKFGYRVKGFYLPENIIVNKKKLKLPSIYSPEKYIYESEFRKDNPYPWDNKTKKKFDIFMEEKGKDNINFCINSCIKYKQCLAILKNLKERREKAIIFDLNITYIPFLHKYLSDNGMISYLFTTHYSVSSRQTQLEKFKNDPNANVLLSSISMLGEGHNVTEANHVIFLSNYLDKNKYYQAIGRCHRFPQKKPVFTYYLFNSKFEKYMYDHANGKVDISTIDWASALLG